MKYADRRSFLKTGALAFGAMGLPNISISDDAHHDKAIVYIYLAGGMSHYESFTAIPTAKDKYRSVNDYIDTKHGFSLGGLWTNLSKHSDKYSVVHSFGHNNAGHQSGTNWIHTGYNFNDENPGAIQNRPSFGSIISKRFGTNANNGTPNYIVLSKIFGQQSAFLGNAYNPFTFDEQGKKSLTLNVESNRLNDRTAMLSLLDNKFARDTAMSIVGEHKRQAFNILNGDIASQFEIANEPESVRKLYGDKDFAKQLLLARRLVEGGAKFISVIHHGWDLHSNIKVGHERLIPDVDFGISALLQDLQNQGMLDSTLVIVGTEFGRTPLNNGNGDDKVPGRDHAPSLTPLLLAGGKYQGKGALGKVDSNGYVATEKPFFPVDLLSTVLEHMNIDQKLQFIDFSGRPRFILEGEYKTIV